ncbi:hypothetical protein ACEPAI_2259 [Sanghuangporus weigelae]
MNDLPLCSSLSDSTTESNTALLAFSHHPEVLAKNRRLCKQHGVDDGPMRLRRLQHFVSQQIIKLLTKHNIKQQNGKPYISSSPKGFLQSPDEWLLERGFCVYGWPRGLPKGSISIWPTHYIFALAAMFINETITLESLPAKDRSRGTCPTRVLTEESSKSRPDDGMCSHSDKILSESKVEERKVDADSDQDAEGSSESEHGSSTDYVVVTSASESRRNLDGLSITSHEPSHPSSNIIQPVISNPMPASSVKSDTSKYLGLVPCTRNSFKSETDIDLTETHSIELLVSADLHLGAFRRRAIDEDAIYQAIPAGAGINWIPPLSATRDAKRVRRV